MGLIAYQVVAFGPVAASRANYAVVAIDIYDPIAVGTVKLSIENWST